MASATNKIIKLLRNKLTFENVEMVLNDQGYSVVFFNTPSGDIEIERYKLFEERDTLMAFTYLETARIVFIDGTLSAEDKLYSALHELGHIVLGHVNSDLFNRNKVLLDIEADNFAYKIVYGEKKGYLYILISAIVLSLSLLHSSQPSFEIIHNSDNIVSEPAITQEALLSYDETVYAESDMVYVTTTGHKYHRKYCRYLIHSTLTELPRSEASKGYAPCKVCKP